MKYIRIQTRTIHSVVVMVSLYVSPRLSYMELTCSWSEQLLEGHLSDYACSLILLALIGGCNLTNWSYSGIRRIGCPFHILQGWDMDWSPWGADSIMVGNQLQRIKLLILLVTSFIYRSGKYFHWWCIIHDMSSWTSCKYRNLSSTLLSAFYVVHIRN